MKGFRQFSELHRNTLMLSGFGVITIIILVLVVRNINIVNSQAKSYQNLSAQCRVWVMESQLHYVQLVAGDHSVDLANEVSAPLQNALTKLEAAYTGSKSGTDHFPSPDENIQALIKNVQYDVRQLLTIIHQQKHSGNYSRVDADQAFSQASKSLTRLADYLSERMDTVQQRARWIFDATLIGLIAAVTLTVFLYYRFHRNNEKLMRLTKTRLDEETNRVETLSRFIEAISNADYSIALETEDSSGLSERLLAMRDKLKANAEEEARRSWASQGMAQIGDILRETSQSGLLYDKLVKFVVNYTGCNQGGLFLVNDDDGRHPFLELISAYAFERKKFITKRVEIGQGMVGQCYLEADRIFLAKLPEEYVHITSGLGRANPTCLLLIPLKANEKVFGVLELASFKRLEEHEIQLIEKFAESIASTVSSVRSNEGTRLLLERSQQQAEEMRAQEEEMRQNMEELSATQEEMARKEREYIRRIQELEAQEQARATAG